MGKTHPKILKRKPPQITTGHHGRRFNAPRVPDGFTSDPPFRDLDDRPNAWPYRAGLVCLLTSSEIFREFRQKVR
jgi:hypothetical protein